MVHDRRGFRYALEPMRNMTEWEMNDVSRNLATANSTVTEQQNKVDGLEHSLAAARSRVLAQRQENARLDIDGQRIAHTYMQKIQQQLMNERTQLQRLMHERDVVLERFNALRKFADNLDEHKATMASEYDREISKQMYQEADDGWLQRLHWRNNA